MSIRKACGLVLVCLLLAPSGTSAQSVASDSVRPFGLTFGAPREQVARVTNLTPGESPGVFTTERVPNAHPDFEKYQLVISPSYGLCKIIAIGKDVETSAYGAEVLSAFDRLKTALQEKYGEPQAYNHLRPGSIWDKSRDWMMSLRQKERTLAAFWTRGHIPGLAPPVQAIGLTAHALTPSKGYVTLAYESANFDPCLDEISRARNNAL